MLFYERCDLDPSTGMEPNSFSGATVVDTSTTAPRIKNLPLNTPEAITEKNIKEPDRGALIDECEVATGGQQEGEEEEEKEKKRVSLAKRAVAPSNADSVYTTNMVPVSKEGKQNLMAISKIDGISNSASSGDAAQKPLFVEEVVVSEK